MWKPIGKFVWLGGLCLLLAAGSARAGVVDVKVPFDFVVHGRILPAGTYRVQTGDSSTVLIRGESGTHAAAFALTTPITGSDPAGEKPSLTFSKHETQYQLDDIWLDGHDGVEVSRPGHHTS